MMSHSYVIADALGAWLAKAALCHFEVSCPPDTLLRSRLPPNMGDNLLQGGSLYFEAECPGWTVYFEVKCPGGGLLQSNLPPRHFTSGVKLLCDSSTPPFCQLQCANCTISSAAFENERSLSITKGDSESKISAQTTVAWNFPGK